MMTFKIFAPLFSLFLTFILATASLAQNSNYTNYDTDQHSIHDSRAYGVTEADYDCFKNIQCLKNNKHLRERGLRVNFESSKQYEQYTLRGEAPNEKVYALYNENGNLVEGEHRKIDVAMPRFITEQLATGPYSEWQMIGNEVVVKNFDTRTTQYQVILEKENRGTVLYFDKNGNQVNIFAGI